MAISPQRLTIYLYSAHRAIIFAIAQFSCSLITPEEGGRNRKRSEISRIHGERSVVTRQCCQSALSCNLCRAVACSLEVAFINLYCFLGFKNVKKITQRVILVFLFLKTIIDSSITLRYDTIEEFNVDSKAEYTA